MLGAALTVMKLPLNPLASAFLAILTWQSGQMICVAQYYEGSVQETANREIARRQRNVIEAGVVIQHAEDKLERKDLEGAWNDYRSAASLVPEAMATDKTYRRALEGYGEASVLFAEQRIAEGRRADAETILNTYLATNPQYRPALQILHRLEEPDYYNPTVTPGFIDRVEEVKKLHREAKGFKDTGRYDLATKRYEQVLNIDKYNIAARRGMEEVTFEQNKYWETSYDQTRSKLLSQVEKSWELPYKRFDSPGGGPLAAMERDPQGTEAIRRKLSNIMIPQLNFANTSVREAIEFLKSASQRLDPEQGADRGVNIVLQLNTPSNSALPAAGTGGGIPGIGDATTATATSEFAPSAAPDPAQIRITLNLTNIPLQEALRYVTELAGLKYKVEPFAVAVVPAWVNTDVLITKEYRVPPGFISLSAAAGGAAAPAAGGFGAPAGDAAGIGSGISSTGTAADSLRTKGVEFPAGASAIYIPSGSRLVVRNTQANLDLIDALIETQKEVPTQVEIEAKFVEVTQSNLKELGFDWLLGPFNIGTERVFGSGGTSGTGTTVNSSNYPFTTSNGSVVGTNPITAGNRSGSNAIASNAIDALISGSSGASAVAPGILALAGVFTDPQFQVVIRALNQQTGVDLMSAPRVTTKAGERAIVEIVREFRYPTEFEPPEIPQDFGNTSGTSTVSVGVSTQPQVFPVTPTTPTAFETRNVGVTMEVLPQVGADGYTIDLELIPSVTEFEGFINYGSPIQTVSLNALGVAQTNVLTENVINQPIFSTRKVQTKVSVWDGNTVVLGGLMREDVQRTQDKVPGLGDLPLMGRLFRSEADQHVKRNLIIFVTARLLDPAGQPILSEEEKEEFVEPLIGPEIAPVAPPPGFAK